MEESERVKEVRKYSGMSQPEFSIFCGLKGNEVSNIENKKQKASNESLNKIGKKYPDFRIWLLSGEEIPDAGHISPMTKATQEKLKA